MSATIPIADPEQMEVCPYDPSHVVQSRRMVYHLEKCRKNFVGQKKTCPFNNKHRIPAPELGYHMSTCPDKALIDQDLRYSGMKQTGFMDDAPRGDLKVPDDDFNVQSEECWDSEINENETFFRLGRKRIDSATIPTKDTLNEQLRLPSITPNAITNAPVYRFSAGKLQGLGRGRGRGIVSQQNGMPRGGMMTNNAPVGRGFGLSKMAVNQQWQKSDSTIVSNTVPTDNTFSVGIGRGIKKKENIESVDTSNKSPKVQTVDELQKQYRRLEKKLRQISKLQEMHDHGTALDKEEEMKLAKRDTLEEELERVSSRIKTMQI